MAKAAWSGSDCAAVYRMLLKSSEGFPACVVAGPDRRTVWLYVHATAPTVLRLYPPVVRFLWDALTDLAGWLDHAATERGALVWLLPRNTTTHPQCVITATGGTAWLSVFAATPAIVKLPTQVVDFLRAALAELPAAQTSHAYRATTGSWAPLDPIPIAQQAIEARS